MDNTKMDVPAYPYFRKPPYGARMIAKEPGVPDHHDGEHGIKQEPAILSARGAGVKLTSEMLSWEKS